MSRPRADACFPTGNGLIAWEDGTTVIRPDLRDSVGDRWYWHVRLQAGHTRPLRIEPELALGTFGPAISYDGVNYRWLRTALAAERAQVFDLPVNSSQPSYVCATIPYGLRRTERFMGECRRLGGRASTIGYTSAGTPIPALLSCLPAPAW